MKRIKRVVSVAFVVMLAFVLAACGGNAGGSASSSAAGADASAGTSAAQSSELGGKPWTTTVVAGNLPASRPEAKDDMYTHYAYDYITAHQEGAGGNAVEDHGSEFRDAVTAVIEDNSKTGHDLEQLRILYSQAGDAKKLEELGLSEVKPYLDRIDAVKSLDEMNALLSASDFPFSPFITAVVKTNDTRATNMVGLYPNFLYSNAILTGGAPYQDTEDPTAQQAAQASLSAAALYTGFDLEALGMDNASIADANAQLMEFEKQHGKSLESNGTYVKKDFGEMAKDARAFVFTLDELCALCPSFPMRETLANMKKDKSEKYLVSRPWLEAFGKTWNAENLDSIKLMAKAKVLAETRCYRGEPVSKESAEMLAQISAASGSNAYKACDSLNTFAQVLAKTYVDESLPASAKERLTNLSQQLINTYKDLVGNTSWLGDESKQRIIEKLDHMALNVLEPTGGYFDYSGLELKPTDQGGMPLANYLTCKQYRYDCEAKMIGQLASVSAGWFYVEPTIANAFYDYEGNSINIMPGIVTSLLYTDGMPDEKLLSGIGFTVGHEISHGFDYQGAQMDAYGQPNPVFTDEDVSKFVDKTTKLAQYYSGIELMPGMMADGQNIVAEANADLCGMHAALEIAGKSENFDYNEFFNNMSNVFVQVVPAQTFPILAMDTHPLNNLRINVNAQMFDPIYDKLGVKEGDVMYLAPDKRIVVWGPKA